jgi:hypothetical protein
MSQDIFQSLWIGNRLSSMEVLSIESFLRFGYEYQLYCYDEIANVPRGAKVCDAREILPATEIFYHQGSFANGSPACFSDMWRYKLLLERGGWWVDTDVVCVRPFQFAGEHVIGHQRDGGQRCLNNAVIRAPARSPLAKYCYEACQSIDRETIQWGATGPKLVQAAVLALGMGDCIEPPEAFYEIDYSDIGRLFSDCQLPEETYGVHLWQAIWKDYGIDLEGPFPTDCLYERMRREFLPDYQSPVLNERQCRQIAARLARACSPAGQKRRRRTQRLVQAVWPWKKAS